MNRRVAAISLALCCAGAVACDEQEGESVDTGGVEKAPAPEGSAAMITAPGLEQRELVAPLADSWSRIDPKKDGWDSEAISAAAAAKLKRLAKKMAHPEELNPTSYAGLLAGEYRGHHLRTEKLEERFRSNGFVVARGNVGKEKGSDFGAALRHLLDAFDTGREVQAELKLYRIEMLGELVKTSVLVHLAGRAGDDRLQVNAEWETFWRPVGDDDPLLTGIEVVSYEECRRLGGAGEALFADSTASVLGSQDAYRRQLLVSTDHWRARIARDFGLDVVANHGLAIGDVNGDGLDDLYLCQQGGLPNRLFLREADGGLRDYTGESATGWLDYCASALILDFDNDGDRDLAVSQDFKILFMDNLGGAKFELALGLGCHAQTFSIAAADYDLDGDLDLYLCGYNPAPDRGETGSLGEPLPYHDARNGGRNKLLRNDGGWEFTDVTDQTGLGENNNRFSFAASWIDYDRDGDQDLYVANDYGRNNFYRNDRGSFRDVAGELGVEDMSAGMSASWGDCNRDGAFDLYVSNMFSAAGNRITYQRQFKEGVDAATIAGFRRHARGNSLFEGKPGATGFTDVSEGAGVTMGRWAWGSRFADINNDGWQDLVVANGFISAPDTGDL